MPSSTPPAGVPYRGAGPTTRHAPPASPGLTVPSGKQVHADVRRRQRHPGKPGPIPLATTEQLVAKAMTDTTSTPQEIAKAVGVSTSGVPVREAIKKARQVLANAAEKYVELHMVATEIAAMKGDAGPAQWALERIAEGGQRVVDAPKTGGPTGPGLRIGIAVGGVPQRSLPPTVDIDEVPVTVDAVDVTP